MLHVIGIKPLMKTISQPTSLLLITDDTAFAATLTSYLQQDGYRLIHYAEASTALACIYSKLPDLVLLDATLSVDDTMMLCQIVRNATSAPLILLTSGDNETERIMGLDMGADLCLIKPLALGELRARIRALLRRVSGIAPYGQQLYSAGHFRLDIDRRRAWTGDRELYLTAREFDLLAYFMRNCGVVLSRTRLLKEVWGEQVSNQSHTLAVHIRWLRQKVEPDPAKPTYIQTVRPLGYRFEVP